MLCYFFSLLFNQFQPNSSLLFTLRSLKLTQIKRIQFNFISRNVQNFHGKFHISSQWTPVNRCATPSTWKRKEVSWFSIKFDPIWRILTQIDQKWPKMVKTNFGPRFWPKSFFEHFWSFLVCLGQKPSNWIENKIVAWKGLFQAYFKYLHF